MEDLGDRFVLDIVRVPLTTLLTVSDNGLSMMELFGYPLDGVRAAFAKQSEHIFES